MSKFYIDEKNVFIIIVLLKVNGIRKVIVLLGMMNMVLIGSM